MAKPNDVLGPTDPPSLRDSATALARLVAESSGVEPAIARTTAPSLAALILERLLQHPRLDNDVSLRLRRIAAAPAAERDAASESWRERALGTTLVHLRAVGRVEAADRLEAALGSWNAGVTHCCVPLRGVLPLLRPNNADFPAGTSRVVPVTQHQEVLSLLLALSGTGGTLSPRSSDSMFDQTGPPLPRHEGLRLPRGNRFGGSDKQDKGEQRAAPALHIPFAAAPTGAVGKIDPEAAALPPQLQPGLRLFAASTQAAQLLLDLPQSSTGDAGPPGTPPHGQGSTTLPSSPSSSSGRYDADDASDGNEDYVEVARLLLRDSSTDISVSPWLEAAVLDSQPPSWVMLPSWDDLRAACGPTRPVAGFEAVYAAIHALRSPRGTPPDRPCPAWHAHALADHALDALRGNAAAARRLAGVASVPQPRNGHVHRSLIPRAQGTSSGAIASALSPFLACGGHRRSIESFIRAHGVSGGRAQLVVSYGRQPRVSPTASCPAAAALAGALMLHMRRVDAALAALPVALTVRRQLAIRKDQHLFDAHVDVHRPASVLELSAHTASLRRQLARLAALCAEIGVAASSAATIRHADAAVLDALYAAAQSADMACDALAPVLRQLLAAAMTPLVLALFQDAFRSVGDVQQLQVVSTSSQQASSAIVVPTFMQQAARDAAQASSALQAIARLPDCAPFLQACAAAGEAAVTLDTMRAAVKLPATLMRAQTWHDSYAAAETQRSEALEALRSGASSNHAPASDPMPSVDVRVPRLGQPPVDKQGPSAEVIAALFTPSTRRTARKTFGGDADIDGGERRAILERAAAGRLGRGAGMKDLVEAPLHAATELPPTRFARGAGLRALIDVPTEVAAPVAPLLDAPAKDSKEPAPALVDPAEDLMMTPEEPSVSGHAPIDTVVEQDLAQLQCAAPDTAPEQQLPVALPDPQDVPCSLSVALEAAITGALARQCRAACAAAVAAAWGPHCRVGDHASSLTDFLLLGRGDFCESLLDAILRRCRRARLDSRGAALRFADTSAALNEALAAVLTGNDHGNGFSVAAHLSVEPPPPGAGMLSPDSVTGLDAVRLRYDPVGNAWANSSWMASVTSAAGNAATTAAGAGSAAGPPHADVLRTVFPQTTLRAYSDAQVALLRLRHAYRAAVECRTAALDVARKGAVAAPAALQSFNPSAADARMLCVCAYIALRVTQALRDHVGAGVAAAVGNIAGSDSAPRIALSLQHIADAHARAASRSAMVADLNHVVPAVRSAALAALAAVLDFRAALQMQANPSTAAALAAADAVRNTAAALAKACRTAEEVAEAEGAARGHVHEADLAARLDLGDALTIIPEPAPQPLPQVYSQKSFPGL